MTEYEYRLFYGIPNRTVRYGGRDKLENDINDCAKEGFEIHSVNYSTGGGGLFGIGVPTAMIIMRKQKR